LAEAGLSNPDRFALVPYRYLADPNRIRLAFDKVASHFINVQVDDVGRNGRRFKGEFHANVPADLPNIYLPAAKSGSGSAKNASYLPPSNHPSFQGQNFIKQLVDYSAFVFGIYYRISQKSS
jgi:hypothetical protein